MVRTALHHPGLYPRSDATEWWRAGKAMYPTAAATQKKLVQQFGAQVDKHFHMPYAHEIVIDEIFRGVHGRRMTYGRGIHRHILAHAVRGKRRNGKKEERIRRATRQCMGRIRDGGKGRVQPGTDLWAVLPVTVFYTGFVVNFGRAAGFWDRPGDDVARVV